MLPLSLPIPGLLHVCLVKGAGVKIHLIVKLNKMSFSLFLDFRCFRIIVVDQLIFMSTFAISRLRHRHLLHLQFQASYANKAAAANMMGIVNLLHTAALLASDHRIVSATAHTHCPTMVRQHAKVRHSTVNAVQC